MRQNFALGCLQHNLGGGGGPHQVVDQDQHVYDSAQGDLRYDDLLLHSSPMQLLLPLLLMSTLVYSIT